MPDNLSHERAITNLMARYTFLVDDGDFAGVGKLFARGELVLNDRSEEHTSELQSLMRISYAVFCLKKKKKNTQQHNNYSKHATPRTYKASTLKSRVHTKK